MKLLKKLSADTDGSAWTDDRIEGVLRSTGEELDTEFLARFRTAKDGTTLVVALVVGERCFIAWAGDSRCVMCRENQSGGNEAVQVSDDHRPMLESEAQRIVAVGGEVVQLEDGCLRVAQKGYQERVLELIRAEQQGLGTIGKPPVAMAVSRSLGDRDFKTTTRGADIISPTPEVRCIRIDESFKFVVLMSDGVTDVMRNDEIVAELSRHGNDGAAAAKCLIQEALGRFSSDNVTVVFARVDWHGIESGLDLGPTAKRQRRACSICGGAIDARGECSECGVISG
jgi:serine/threonine protein phosphatase PrpC